MDFIRRLLGRNSTRVEETSEQETTRENTAQEPTTISIPGAPVDSTVAPALDAETDAQFGITRQLPTLEMALTRPNQHIVYGQSTNIGMVRTNNQDALLTFFASQGNADTMPDFGLFVVADGMGGHHDGEKASTIATQVFAEQVARNIYLPMLVEWSHDSDSGNSDIPLLSELLVKAIRKSNEIVVKSVPEGGTTITASIIVGDIAYLAHVGDSRAYLITQEFGMEQLTRDHSLVQRLIELDQLSPEEASQHPQKNVLYRAIGQSDNLEVDAVTRRLPANSFILLCSDGLWNTVPEDVLLDIVFTADNPQTACDRMISAANEHGGSDNISAIVLQVPG